MAMTNIFKPLRHPATDQDLAEGKYFPLRADNTESGDSRETRMGTQPVTNTFPSGPTAFQATNNEKTADEDTWLAMLEIVFAATGWPDAEES